MYFKQERAIFTLSDKPLKLVDQFTCLGSNISSTKSDVNIRIGRKRTAIDRLSIIWKSGLTDKMKRDFFKSKAVSILLYGCTTWKLTKRVEKRLDGNTQEKLNHWFLKHWYCNWIWSVYRFKIGVVAIERGAFGPPRTTVANFTYNWLWH